jgi:hypothetical protein
MLIFELPSDKYTAFRYVCTEIIQNISYILKEKTPEGQYMMSETQKFYDYVT